MEADDPGEVMTSMPPPAPSTNASSSAAATATTAAAGSSGSSSKKVTTRAGTGTAAMAGMVATWASGDAEATSPVHGGAYGMAVEEEVEDLLSSHMKFMLG